MLRVTKMNDRSNIGASIVFLWIFTLTFIFQMDGKGDHINIGFGIAWAEITMGFTIWRKLP
jgi:hypothetical protein|tara:strand:- start:3997 stop:4179 length:183 start_codon:yes stop_codon:yes gene_type:complete